MNLLLSLNSPAVGGVQTHVLALTQGLMHRGHSPTLLTDSGYLEQEMTAMGLPFHARVEGLEPMVELLLRLVDETRPAVIHAHHGTTDWESYQVFLRAGIPFVLTIHGLLLWGLERGAMGDLLASAVGRVVAVSKPVKDYLLAHTSLSPAKIRLVPNGVDTEEFRPERDAGGFRHDLGWADDEIVAMYVGRVAAEKRHAFLAMVEAVRILARRGIRVRGVLVGKTDVYMHQTVLDLARAINTETNRETLILAGLRRDLPRLLSAADVVVAAGRSALEALAAGKPTVAWGCAGYVGPVTADNWHEALETNFGDHAGGAGPDPIELAEILRDLSAAPGEGNAVRALVVEECGLEKTASAMEAIYREAAGYR